MNFQYTLSHEINLYQIANSGQCFRWKELSSGGYQVPIYDFMSVVSSKSSNGFIVESQCPVPLVREYFDLDTDYGTIIQEVANYDNYLLVAALKFQGLRILRQSLWETIISFIISQNNNITRISRIINQLCEDNGGIFPNQTVMSYMDLNKYNLGYRQKYIENLLKSDINIDYLKSSSYQDALKYLQQYPGIGPKVANCICLFGLHHLEACPIDIWMKRIIDKRYDGKYPKWMDSKYAGIYQQYCFCHERYLSSNSTVLS